ncbi:MAG: hypothetical protein HY858_11970 [Candidatus Solibacter usitatus]|nr:hypothetical protein [Candidatus Solibacter usitatus]
MSPLSLLLLLLSSAAYAQLWPDPWHGSARTSTSAPPIADPMLWAEYGGQASEKAVYNGPVGRFSATAWRLDDSTAALAWFQAIRPANCASSSLTACATPGAQFVLHQNYVLLFEGWRPLPAELAELYPQLPRLRSGGGLPLLPAYLPEKNRVRNSERYVLGPHSLQRFLPAVPAALAGLEDGVEAQVASFSSPSGPATLAVFYFLTPQLAILKAREFEKLPGFAVKRTGAFVALASPSPSFAATILRSIESQSEFVWNTPGKLPEMPNVAGMLVAIAELTGLLLIACVAGGLVFAFFRAYFRNRRIRLAGTDSPFTFLHVPD